jgi:hypothetical protein
LPASSFFAWKRKLGPSPAASAFVEATVTDVPTARPAAAIEIRLRGRRRVRVGRRGFDRARALVLFLLWIVDALCQSLFPACLALGHDGRA